MIDASEELKLYLYVKKSRQDEAGIAPLYARVSLVSQKPFEFDTKLRIPLSYWDGDGQQIRKGKNPQLAKELGDLVDKMEEVHHELSSIGGIYGPDQFKFMLFGPSKKTTHYTYNFVYQKHFNIEEDDIASGTWKNYRSTHKFFQEYLVKELKVKDIAIARFTRQLMIEFMAWLKKRTPDKGQKPCSITTAQKHVERLVRLLNFSVEMQYIPFNPVVNLKKKKIQKDRTCLDSEELSLLESFSFEKPHHQEICDSFLFSCYTGLSYSDIRSFNRGDLIKDMSGTLCIAKVRQKTSRTREVKFYVPLLPQATQILQKYANNPGCLHKNVLLPVRSNQIYNRSIKAIATLVGIDKNLTTHVARHTFATTVTQDNGVSLESISEMLGHTQIKTTQIYSKTTLKKVSGEMQTLSAKLMISDSQVKFV